MVKEKIAIDTNVVIAILNGRQSTIDLLNDYQAVYLPVIVCGELLFGAKNSARSDENEQKCLAFINECRLLNIHELIAQEYAATRKKLKSKGKPIPENDIWIASTCIVNNLPLASYDADFKWIDELVLIDLKP